MMLELLLYPVVCNIIRSNDVVTPVEALKLFDSLQPMLMENLYIKGFSVGLENFYILKKDGSGL